MNRVICCCMAQIMGSIPRINPVISSALGVISAPSLLSVIGCRLMIHLKEAGPKEAKGRNTNVSHFVRRGFHHGLKRELLIELKQETP